MAADKDGSWKGSMGFAQFAADGEEDSSEEEKVEEKEQPKKKQELIGRGMGCAHFAGGGAVRGSNNLEVRRGHIRGFVRGKDRKESLSRQKRMDQLKDRFQVQGGEREKTMTSDDEDTYGPKISGADIKTGKQKIIVADSISESSHVGDLGAKRKCEGLINNLQGLPEPETSTSTVKNVSKVETRFLIREKSEVEEQPHIQWKEGYDRVLPEDLLSSCLPDECLICKVKLPSGGARQHYWGSRHAKSVARAVEHLPRGERPRRVIEGQSITPTLTSKVMEEAQKAWSLKPKEYEPPVNQQEKEQRARFRVSRGQIHHYNKDSRRLDFWI